MSEPRSALRIGADALLAAERNNAERWEPAVRLLASADGIWCSGLGKSGLVAQKLAATLRSFGRRAHFLHPVEALHGDAGALRTGEAMVVISASGRTEELLRLVRGGGVPLVALTRLDSPLASLAHATLDGSVEVEAGGHAPLTSSLVATAVADVLALRLRSGDTLKHDGGFIGLRQRTVESIMKPPPTVGRSMSLAECIARLGDGAVLVEGGGIFTDGDLRRAVGADPAALSRPVGELCTRCPVTVGVGEPASVALDRMERRERQLSVLPVVDERGAYVGLVRLHDLVRAGMGA